METNFDFLRKTPLWIISFFLICFTTNAQLVFDKGQYQVDENLHLIICNRLSASIDSPINTIKLDKVYSFSSTINTIQIGQPYDVYTNENLYKLYFTQIPIVAIQVPTTIQDDYSHAVLTVADTIGEVVNSPMGIKLHGSLSRTYPKKSYHIQLWTDSTGATTQNKSFFGMRNDQTWLLLAMYDEKLRMNNKLSHELWLKFHKLYYADQEPDAHSTIRTKYVEVFLNGDYQGVYLFTEDTDRKQLQLKKQTTSAIGGELYKSSGWTPETLFTGLSQLPTTATDVWESWEVEYPDTTNWVNLYQFTDFAVNASDSSFKQQISTKIREDNFADYFIFLNLIRATDNFGKNLFLARYNNGEPYFIVPWDLNGTWGYLWAGITTNITDDILTNNLFNRLLTLKDFRLQLATRWFSSRTSVLSIDSLALPMTNYYNFLIKNGVYERESLKWSGQLLSYSTDELNYIQTWMKNRVGYLDGYFKNLVQDQPVIFRFTAEASQQKAIVSWSANGIAISSFDIEYSTDSLSWKPINEYPIFSNDSLAGQYHYIDENPGTGIAYYRLKITDKQSSVSYSTVQRLDFSLLENLIRVYPNPVSTTLQVQGSVEKVDVYSTRGIFLYASDYSSPNLVNVNNLPSGMYLVRVTQKSGLISTYKVMVSR